MMMKMHPLGKAEFGATTFCASPFSNDECGANGLPLTPNSIKIFGRFQRLKKLSHPNICRYVDLVRCRHERVIVVSEHYRHNLQLELKSETFSKSTEKLVTLSHELLSGLAYLHEHQIVVRNICPKNVLIDTEGRAKLTKYGLCHMTVYGDAVPFPMGHPAYSSPEVLSSALLASTNYSRARGNRGNDEDENDEEVSDWLTRQVAPHGGKADTWSVGVVLLQAALGVSLWPHLTLSQLVHKVSDMTKSDLHPVDIIAQENDGLAALKDLPTELDHLLRKCLTVNIEDRPTPRELIKLPIFLAYKGDMVNGMNGLSHSMFSTSLRCKDLTIEPYDPDTTKQEAEEDHLGGRSIDEVYYLWRLAGGDLEATLKRAGLIRSKPPVMNLASFTLDSGDQFGQPKDRSILLDDTVVILPQDQLRQRLSSIDPASYYPLLEEDTSPQQLGSLPTSPSSVDLSGTSKLPLVIREKDVEYQFHRIILFSRLLTAYPYKRQHIWKEARVDIPPLVRPQVWAAVLEIEGDVHGRYDAIDKETPTPTDRQIEVDVPRCHQYNDLFSSPQGHAKFKRILKAWVVSHPEYVYWQGLDSLCAPFLHLNFNDEAVAFACLDAFIPKYLHKFFLKDNSQVIQEYLAVFSHLITFHDPELANHLNGIGFIPDLYSIPWFLTMYAHVFPLHKIFHLWDTLLLGNTSFPLFIGVAILQQLRAQLLSFGFNECILLFSDMPEIDIQRCVQDSIRLFCSTPKSAAFRQHARPPRQAADRKREVTGSYYSQEYSAAPQSDMSRDPLPLADLKLEKCARVSADDILDLCDLVTTRSPNNRQRNAKPKIIFIDVRSQEEYERGTVPGSINIPFFSAFTPDGTLSPWPGVTSLNQGKPLIKVVLAGRVGHAVTFAEKLVALDYSRVCVLHNGIDSVRSAGVLTVPTPEL